MTKALSYLVYGLVRAISALLPASKRMKFRANLFDLLKPFESVVIAGRPHKLFTPDKTSVYWVQRGPTSEPVTNRWIEDMAADDMLVDAGANVGFFSLYAASHGVRSIVAIEPNPISFNALCLNVLVNGYSDAIKPLNLALFNQTGSVVFEMSGMDAGSIENSINMGGTPEGNHLNLAGASLDFLMAHGFLSGATHLKIDIDGLELEVLQGATEFLDLASLKSVLVEDDGDPEKIAQRDSLMADHGFQVFDDFGDQANYTIFVRPATPDGP